MFVTNFVLYSIFECLQLGSISQPDMLSLEAAVDAILSFHDKNQPEGTPIYNFWPQILVNNTWMASPSNL